MNVTLPDLIAAIALLLIAAVLVSAQRTHKKQRVVTEIISGENKSIIGDGAVIDWTPVKSPKTARIRDIEPRGV